MFTCIFYIAETKRSPTESLNKGEVYYNLKELYIMFPHRG